MTGIAEGKEIYQLTDRIVEAILPLKVYLFGSFAEGKSTSSSDYDFYVVVDDATTERMLTLTAKAYKAIRHLQGRSVDLIVNKESRFNARKDMLLTVESEVARKGVLLYSY